MTFKKVEIKCFVLTYRNFPVDFEAFLEVESSKFYYYTLEKKSEVDIDRPIFIYFKSWRLFLIFSLVSMPTFWSLLLSLMGRRINKVLFEYSWSV